MSESLCGAIVASRRGLLAFLWSIVTMLTAVAFLIALAFALTASNSDDDSNYNNNYNEDEKEGQYYQEPVLAVTSRAMAFAALWTAVLASLLSLFGTVILGFQSPTGQYYTCCSASVHRTTQLGLGSFIGALIMFANLTLVCSVLFGEFQIRDYDNRREEGEKEEEGQNNSSSQDNAVDRSSMAFSIMCMFLTVLYAGFAILTYANANSVMEENLADYREEAMHGGHHHHNRSNPSFLKTGYIGERFDVRPSTGPSSNAGTFVAPTPPKEATMA